MSDTWNQQLERRAFFSLVGRRTLQVGLAGSALPLLLAACRSDDALTGGSGAGGRAIVGDVLGFKLTSDEWTGAFGSVTFRLNAGVFEGRDVYYIRTDVSDQDVASAEKLVFVPKMAGLVGARLTADAYLVENGVGGQATVLSTEPGRSDYTPAWRINRARFTGTPVALRSVADVKAAERKGDLVIERTPVVLNGPVVKWSSGEMPVDTERTGYLGPGQLLSKPDTKDMSVTFKLHECFPGSRYIVTDVSAPPMADGMKIVASPKLAGSSKAKATGRVNVFMGGVKGDGPMGGQSSVFDSQAGQPAWSPYWDHFTYAWKEGATGRVLTNETEVHAARDAGDLTEFPGTPDTKGTIFTVNCPVPVLAPNSV